MEADKQERIKTMIESYIGLKLIPFEVGGYFVCIPNQHVDHEGWRDDINGHLWQACCIALSDDHHRIFRFDPLWSDGEMRLYLSRGLFLDSTVKPQSFGEMILNG